MNLLLLDDCGRFADEWHMVGFDDLRVIRLPSPDEIITAALNDTIREQLAEMSPPTPGDVTVIAFTHTWIHPQEMEAVLRHVDGCTVLCRGDDFVDIVVLTDTPDIPEGSVRDFYDLLDEQFEVSYVEVTTATRAVVEDPEAPGAEPEFTDED
jgi:hypothetical protein